MSYTCFLGTWVVEQFGGKKGSINLKSCAQSHTKSNPKSSIPYFKSNETLLQCLGPIWVELYLFHGYPVIGAIWGNCAQIPQIMSRDTQKVIQSFQHRISYWMTSYSSAKTIWELSYTCFKVFGVLGQFGETWPQCPNFSKIVKFNYINLWSFKFSV